MHYYPDLRKFKVGDDVAMGKFKLINGKWYPRFEIVQIVKATKKKLLCSNGYEILLNNGQAEVARIPLFAIIPDQVEPFLNYLQAKTDKQNKQAIAKP